MTHGSSSLSLSLQKAKANRFLRFLGIGVLNTAFGYAVYLVGLLSGAAPSIALAGATVAGVLFNYRSTGLIVFGHRDLNRLPAFVAAYVLTYAINAAALASLIAFGWRPAVAQLVLLPAMAILSFCVLRSLVFRPGRPE